MDADIFGFGLMHTLGSDAAAEARAIGNEMYDSMNSNYDDSGFDMRPDLEPITIDLYLAELGMTLSDYERRF